MAVTAPHKGGARGPRAYAGSAFRDHGAIAGFPSPRVPPTGVAPLAAGGWRGAATTKPVVLPLPSGAGSAMKSRSGKGSRTVSYTHLTLPTIYSV